jgi:tetratricopeptide (TPR) repeat protein
MADFFARALVAVALLGLPVAVAGQGKAPSLSKEQRQALMAAVTAVKAAADLPASDEGWQTHLLRASDGSHYVAFSAEAPPGIPPDATLAVYVRLAPRPPVGTALPVAVRSPVEEWLLGQRTDPLPRSASRVVQVPTGDFPVGGPLAGSSRDALGGQNQAALRLMELDLERQKHADEAAERARRAEMEEGRRTEPMWMPFEDFDVAAHLTPRPGRAPVFRRALTAGPGDYDLSIGWAALDARNRPTSTGVLKHGLHLPTTQGGLALGSIILADAITARKELYRTDQQTAHPYAIGLTEIEPAADAVFTNEERLSVVFQVFGAAPSPTGKPDVSVGFRLFRFTEQGEQPAGSLTPLEYNQDTLPVDFNLLQGHPIIAAMAAPLRTLARGEYRLAIAATDRLGRASATADTRFRVVATPAALLASAPPFVARVRRTWFMEADVLAASLDALPASARTPAAAPLLASARERRFVSLLADSSIPEGERGLGLMLQALARFALGDTPTTVAVQLRRAADAGAPDGATQFWLGACRATEGKDEDALIAWEAARRAGWPEALLALPTAEALVRLMRLDEAGAAARRGLDQGVQELELRHIAAAADITGGRYESAAALLRPALATNPDDSNTPWLMLHALFASAIKGERPGATPEGQAEWRDLAARYVAAGGQHRAVVDEWGAYLISSSAASP